MKISYNWLSQYLDEPLTPARISEILTGTGLEVESLETWSSVKGGLQDLVSGKVISVEKHPNADKLKLTRVDTGQGQLLSIVCGAPNVEAGQFVVVAPVGASVHPLEKDSFLISRSKIRGEWSEGMLCAEDEIGLGKSHEGIMVLAGEPDPGTSIAELLGLSTDHVFEIGITPNRSDALSHRGVARDLTAYHRKAFLYPVEAEPGKFQTAGAPPEPGSGTGITIEQPGDCLRFSGAVLESVTVADSPAWLQNRLKAIGIRPINNVVDITNFISHDTGQPMHAYDLAKLKGKEFIAGRAGNAQTLVTLDGVERKLHSDDLIIKDKDGQALGLAGVFGGLSTAVSLSSTRIFLESACFSPVAVRKTARRHGLNTDASFRFERGTDVTITLEALQMAVTMMQELCGAKLCGKLLDVYPEPVTPRLVVLRRKYLDQLVGQHIPDRDVDGILLGLGMRVRSLTRNDLSVNSEKPGISTWELEIPAFRVEVTREADVVEEVLRIYGYNSIAFPLQIKSSLPPVQALSPEQFQFAAAEWLSARGMNEIMTSSLVPAPVYSAEKTTEPVELLNPLSSDLSFLRSDLLQSGLKVVAFNHNRRQTDLRLYEFGKIYAREQGKYRERQILALYQTGKPSPAHWLDKQADSKASQLDGFFELKGLVSSLFSRLEIGVLERTGTEGHLPLRRPLEWLDVSGSQVLATMGQVSGELLERQGISTDVWYVQIEWEQVFALRLQRRIAYTAVSRFPAVTRDLSLVVPEAITYQELRLLAVHAGVEILADVQIFDVFRGEKIGEGLKSYALTFTLESRTQTLTDREIEQAMNRLSRVFSEKAGAEVRSS